MASTSREERVAALYARVIRRVCERFEQHVATTSDGVKDESEQRRLAAAALVEAQWRERLTRYTGHAYAALVVSEPSEAEEAPSARQQVERHATESDAHSQSDTNDAAPLTAAAMGRPHALHHLRAPISIFATILSGKRKMEQLDGTVEDPSDGEDTESDDAVEGDDASAASSTQLTTTAPAPSGQNPPLEIAPATALSLALVPLQCAARDVSFDYRKNAVRGRVKNAIVTLLRRVRADEAIAPKHLLWLTRSVETEPASSASITIRQSRGQGMLVEVVEVLQGGAQLVVQVAGSAQTHRVDVQETRRFYECVISSGYVHLRFVHT